MNKLQALKIRIYPNKTQEQQILKTLGCCRFLYNQMLAERKDVYELLKDDKRKLYEHDYKTEKQYKIDFEFLKEADSQALQQARINLSVAYQNFFRRLKDKKIPAEEKGFPKFKKKHAKNSYRTVMTNNNLSINFEERKLKLPKLTPIPFRDNRNISDIVIKAVTITRTKTGKYYASVLIEREVFTPKKQDLKTKNLVIKGLDMSLTNFFIDEQGNSPAYDKMYSKYEKRLGRLQKFRSKTKTRTNNYERLCLKINRIHEYLANYRRNFVEQLSTKLIVDNDVIVVESLSLKDMAKFKTWEERKNLVNKGNYGKSITDLGWGMFLNKLKYKADMAGKTVIEASKWFASSQICCICGYQSKEITDLSIREWICPRCDNTHFRDQNAAINLVNYGLKAPVEQRFNAGKDSNFES